MLLHTWAHRLAASVAADTGTGEGEPMWALVDRQAAPQRTHSTFVQKSVVAKGILRHVPDLESQRSRHQGSRSRSSDAPSLPHLVWCQCLPTGFSGPSLSGCPSLEML